MIRLKDGDNKLIYLNTLRDRTTLENPKYLFKIINNRGSDQVWKSNDMSDYPVRYNAFTFSVNNNTDSNLGGFTASEGQYLLEVYETEFDNLIVGSATTLIKQDILEIYDNYDVFTYSNSTNNWNW